MAARERAQIAQRAGVSRRTTQIAIKRANSLGLIAVEDIPGGKHVIVNRYIRHRGGGRSSDCDTDRRLS
jgi:DNA-binding transcriptional regulator LsrR (DeoR family)